MFIPQDDDAAMHLKDLQLVNFKSSKMGFDARERVAKVAGSLIAGSPLMKYHNLVALAGVLHGLARMCATVTQTAWTARCARSFTPRPYQT